MAQLARSITILIPDFPLNGYQITVEAEEIILFTHRQIGEIIGKTKSTAGTFFRHQTDLPTPIKAVIPERKGAIALTPLASAMVYWQHEAQKGNQLALKLIKNINNEPITKFEIIKAEEKELTVTPPTISNQNYDLKIISEGIEIASKWMVEAGVEPTAIAHWKLTQLGLQIPELNSLITSAQEVIANHTPSPQGLIVSQLATKISQQMAQKITSAKINQALHDLEYQDWAKVGVNRERKLTEQGKQYGIAILTTSKEGWQGAQLRWREEIIPILVDYFSQTSHEARSG